MANGANRLFKVFTETSKATNTIPSQMVSLTVKSIQPLVFMRDDRLEIPEEFCLFSRLVKKENIKVGDIVTAMVFNEGQSYFIEDNNSDDLVIISKAELEEILEAYLLKAGGQVTGIIDNIEDGFAGFRKHRTINDENYYVDFTAGSNNSTANGTIEVHKEDGTVIARLDVRGDNGRIQNSKTGKYLSEENDTYFLSGDSFTYWVKSVVIAASTTLFRFQISLSKPVKSGVNVSVTILGGSLFQSGGNWSLTPANCTTTTSIVGGTVLEVSVNLSSAIAYTANRVTTGDINIRVDFS